jgi:hypothetical protein
MWATKFHLITSAAGDLYAIVGVATMEKYRQEYTVFILQY